MAVVIGGLNPPMTKVLQMKLYMGLMAGRFRIQRFIFREKSQQEQEHF